MSFPLAVAALLFASLAGAAGLDLARLSPPGADYSLQYPADWRKSLGSRTVILRPSGSDLKAVRFRLEEHKGDPKRFADKLAAKAEAGELKKLDSRAEVKLDGRDAARLEFIETAKLTSRFGGPLPGPLSEVYYVVPRTKGFLVLAWEGFGEEYARRKPELEAIAASLRWSVAKP